MRPHSSLKRDDFSARMSRAESRFLRPRGQRRPDPPKHPILPGWTSVRAGLPWRRGILSPKLRTKCPDGNLRFGTIPFLATCRAVDFRRSCSGRSSGHGYSLAWSSDESDWARSVEPRRGPISPPSNARHGDAGGDSLAGSPGRDRGCLGARWHRGASGPDPRAGPAAGPDRVTSPQASGRRPRSPLRTGAASSRCGRRRPCPAGR
jgi:hypothetical protein